MVAAATAQRGKSPFGRENCERFIGDTLAAHGEAMRFGKVSADSPPNTLGRLCYDEGYKKTTVYNAMKSAGIVHNHDADGKTWWSLPTGSGMDAFDTPDDEAAHWSPPTQCR